MTLTFQRLPKPLPLPQHMTSTGPAELPPAVHLATTLSEYNCKLEHGSGYAQRVAVCKADFARSIAAVTPAAISSFSSCGTCVVPHHDRIQLPTSIIDPTEPVVPSLPLPFLPHPSRLTRAASSLRLPALTHLLLFRKLGYPQLASHLPNVDCFDSIF